MRGISSGVWRPIRNMPQPRAKYVYNKPTMKRGNILGTAFSGIYAYGPQAAASGLLLWLSFPKPDLYSLAFIALAPLLLAVREQGMRDSVMAGLITGLVYFCGTQYWVYHSVHYYGGVPLVLSFTAVLLLAMYQALYIGAFAGLAARAANAGVPFAISAPVFWTALEYTRGHALTGFPWSALGYSQYKFLSFIQCADVIGLYGIGFLIVAVSGAVADWWPHILERKAAPAMAVKISTVALAAILVAVIGYGRMRLSEQRPGDEITAGIVQGSIDQSLKWDPAYQTESVNIYKALTLESAKQKPRVIIWPESATPFYFIRDRELTEDILALARATGVPILTGAMIARPGAGQYYDLSNSAVLIGADGAIAGVYDKVHLVPFGEYIPMRKALFFINRLTAGIGDFRAGKKYTLLRLPDHGPEFATVICYEIIFPELVRGFFKDGRGEFLVTVTNDAWFGRTAAPYQHWAMSVMRAIENRKPVLRAANTGISGVIDSSGRIQASTRLFERGQVTEGFRTDRTRTFYSRHGDLLALLCIVSGIIIVVASRRKNKK